VKTLKFNRCPAISPVSVLKDAAVQERLKVTPEVVNANKAKLAAATDFVANVVRARNLLDDERGEEWSKEKPDADTALYGNGGGFFDDNDKRLMSVVRAAKPDELTGLSFHDHRLEELLPRYKARNFSGNLTDEERAAWEDYRYHLLLDGGTESRLARFAKHRGELAETETGQEKRYLLEELQLYAESVMPVVEADQ